MKTLLIGAGRKKTILKAFEKCFFKNSSMGKCVDMKKADSFLKSYEQELREILKSNNRKLNIVTNNQIDELKDLLVNLNYAFSLDEPENVKESSHYECMPMYINPHIYEKCLAYLMSVSEFSILTKS